MTLSNTEQSEMTTDAVLLSGTPSQVEWAQRIRLRVVQEFARVARSFQMVALTQSAINRADTRVILRILEAKRLAVMSRREAGYFIRDWQEIDDQVRKLIGDDLAFQQIQQKRLHARQGAISMEKKKMETIRPLYDRIVVKRSEDQEITRNGIYIPDSAKEKPQEGEVIAVGHGKRLEDGTLVALDVKVGDRILFGKYSGTETKLAGTEYIIIREDDVLGILGEAVKSVKAA